MPVTIAIPVYNEEEIIERNTKRLIDFLNKNNVTYEIIICDNGSTDRTVELGRKLENKYKNVKFFSIYKKGAVGWAFRKCVMNARYNKIVSVDMDLSVELDFVPECEKLLDRYNLVVGSKIMGNQNRSLLRTFASAGFILLARAILGIRSSDYSMAAKGYRKQDIYRHLYMINKGSAYVMQLIYFIEKEKKKIIQIPVMCDDRRRSRFNFVEEIIYRFRELILFRIRTLLK